MREFDLDTPVGCKASHQFVAIRLLASDNLFSAAFALRGHRQTHAVGTQIFLDRLRTLQRQTLVVSIAAETVGEARDLELAYSVNLLQARCHLVEMLPAGWQDRSLVATVETKQGVGAQRNRLPRLCRSGRGRRLLRLFALQGRFRRLPQVILHLR